MEKKVSKAGGKKVAAFFKRNIYYVLMVICVIAIGTMITVAAVVNSDKGGGDIDTNLPGDGTNGDGNGGETPTEKPKDEFIMTMPVKDGETQMVFNNSTLVFDKTENKYYTHLGLDVMGSVDADVFANFDGTIESITTDGYKGVTVVINHNNGYKTSLSLMDKVTAKQGQAVKKGDILGKIGGAFLFESLEGAHIHMELTKDGIPVDPTLFMPGDDK